MQDLPQRPRRSAGAAQRLAGGRPRRGRRDLGPSGCGKTTLLNCTSGFDHHDAGTVRITRIDPRHLSNRQKAACRARHRGFALRTCHVLPVPSVVENVELPLVVSAGAASAARRRALEMLDRVRLADSALRAG